MTIQELQEFYANKYKKGTNIQVVYVHVEGNGFSKKTIARARLVNYYNTKYYKNKVANGQAKPQQTTNDNVIQIIPHILTFNKNTNNYLVHLQAPSKGKIRKQVLYYDNNGNEIDKATYETMVPPKKSYAKAPSPTIQIKLQELVQIG